MLVARRELRLKGIAENAMRFGARHVMIMAADVVKEDDCKRFVNETVNVFGRVDHLVNTVSLGHTFYFEEVTDTSVFPVLLVHMSGGAVEEFARMKVSGACRGNAYVKFPSWYDVFMLYRVFAPNVLNWAFRLLISPQGTRRISSYIGTGKSLDTVGVGRPMMEGISTNTHAAAGIVPLTFSGQLSH